MSAAENALKRHPNVFMRWRASPIVRVAPNGDRLYITEHNHQSYLQWVIGLLRQFVPLTP